MSKNLITIFLNNFNELKFESKGSNIEIEKYFIKLVRYITNDY